MKIQTYSNNQSEYKYAFIVEESSLNKEQLVKIYFEPLVDGHPNILDDFLFIGVSYDKPKTASIAHMKSEMEQVKKVLDKFNTKVLWIADNNYFRFLTKLSNPTAYFHEYINAQREGFEEVACLINYTPKAYLVNPNLKYEINDLARTFSTVVDNTYVTPGSDIVHSSVYIYDYPTLKYWLKKLLSYPRLAIDIETIGLLPSGRSMISIAFSWNKHNGIVISWPAYRWPTYTKNVDYTIALHDFFLTYKGKKIFHNATFDIKHILANLFEMENVLQIRETDFFEKKDPKNFFKTFEAITSNVEDTKILAYLCTNNVSGNSLSLESLAQSFAGKWGLENKDDIESYPIEEVMKYNLVDTLATNYLYDEFSKNLIIEDQVYTYESVFKPSIKTLVFMELVGFPLNADVLHSTSTDFTVRQTAYEYDISNDPVIKFLNLLIREEEAEKANKKLKTIKKSADDFDTEFNPGSSNHLRFLLHKVFKLPVLDRTTTGLPSTDEDALTKLINYCKTDNQKQLIQHLLDLQKISKITSTFIDAFNKFSYFDKPFTYPGSSFRFGLLQGNFNLGGTVSGRLSSSNPNLQQLPSGSTYGKEIKNIFRAPQGWLFVGIDFAALEERVNTILTKDPAKEKVYLEGFDGHSLRMYTYWNEKFTNVDPTPKNINKLGKDNPELRNKSKPVTFALQYFGTYKTIMNQGFDKLEATKIYQRYHELYKTSNEWVNAKLDEAAKRGYGLGAFGLKIRCPLLQRTISGSKVSLKEAEGQRRTLGNAISGQSYGLLNSRAMNAVMERVWASEYYNQILPVGQIHDAGYYLLVDDVDLVAWFNNVVVEEMEWRDLPELKDSPIPLTAELEIFYPSWANPIGIPNKATPDEIRQVIEEYKVKNEPFNHIG